MMSFPGNHILGNVSPERLSLSQAAVSWARPLWSLYYVAGTLLGAGDKLEGKFLISRAYGFVGELGIKQISRR